MKAWGGSCTRSTRRRPFQRRSRRVKLLPLAAFQADRAQRQDRGGTSFAGDFLVHATLPRGPAVLWPYRHGIDLALTRHDDRARSPTGIVRRHGLNKNSAAPPHVDDAGLRGGLLLFGRLRGLVARPRRLQARLSPTGPMSSMEHSPDIALQALASSSDNLPGPDCCDNMKIRRSVISP
jgi:hypothetical protein